MAHKEKEMSCKAAKMPKGMKAEHKESKKEHHHEKEMKKDHKKKK